MDKEDTEDPGGNIIRPEEMKRAFIATSPLVFMIACCAFIANVVGINMLNDRLRDLRSEQFTQPSEINNKVWALDSKIEMLVGQLQRVERMALEVAEDDRPVAPCGNVAPDRTKRSPHQENVNDGRE